ncbi:MAG: M48 family metallopeptidase, partial [Sphingomicrobium sp.]
MCWRCTQLSRRSLLAGGGLAAASLATGVAQARIKPADMVPLVGPGYKPTDKDEQGLWQQMARVEEEIAGSNLLIDDPALNAYLKDLIGKVGGPAAKDFRIYLAHIPEFNAVMFPTGFAVIFSGLLLRMRNEAQLAGVIAHESGHFLRRHMIRSWRDMRRKSDIFAVGAMVAGVAGAGVGVNTGNYVRLAQLGTMLSLFHYSRTMEAEADAIGANLMEQAGYPPVEMADIWQQLINEDTASARYRRKRRDRGYSLFASHPAPETRMADLRADAAEVTVAGKAYDNHRARYLEQIASIRPMLLDDQVKLNDPGASQYLIETLAQDGWD